MLDNRRWLGGYSTRRHTHTQVVFGLSVADFLISMEQQLSTINF